MGFYDRALEIASEITRNAAREGRFRLGTYGYFPFPSFFYGESGVLYNLARVLEPEKIPSLWGAGPI
jgi:hypothetical protein